MADVNKHSDPDSKPGVLRNLKIKRIALVDNGANFDKATGDGAHIYLFKRDVAKSPSVASVHVDTPMGDDDKKKNRKPPNQESKEKSMANKFIKGLLGLFTETDPEKRAAKAAELEKDFPVDDDDKLHKADDPMCKCDSCVSMRAEKLAKSGDAVMKAAVDAVRTEMQKKVDEATKAANDAVAIAKAEKEARLDTEMSAVLKGFRSIPFDLKDNADVKKFRKMKEDDPDLYDRTMAIFKAAEAQLTTSGIYKQYGSGMSGGDGGDAWGELVAKADALVEKSTSGLTQEQALDKVMQDPRNNKIVKRYREQQQASH